MVELLLLIMLLLLWNLADFFYNMIFKLGETFTIERILGLISPDGETSLSGFGSFFSNLSDRFVKSPMASMFIVLFTIAIFIMFASALFAVFKGMVSINEETKKKFHPITVFGNTIKASLYFLIYTTVIFVGFFVINAFTNAIGEIYRDKQVELPISSVLAQTGDIDLFGFGRNVEEAYYHKENITTNSSKNEFIKTKKVSIFNEDRKNLYQEYSIAIHNMQKYLLENQQNKGKINFYMNIEPVYSSSNVIKVFEKDGQVYPYYQLVNEIYLVFLIKEQEWTNNEVKILLENQAFDNNNLKTTPSELSYLNGLYSVMRGKKSLKSKKIYRMLVLGEDALNNKKENSYIARQSLSGIGSSFNPLSFLLYLDKENVNSYFSTQFFENLIKENGALNKDFKNANENYKELLKIEKNSNENENFFSQLTKEEKDFVISLFSMQNYKEYLDKHVLINGLINFYDLKQETPFKFTYTNEKDFAKEFFIPTKEEYEDYKKENRYEGYNLIGDNYKNEYSNSSDTKSINVRDTFMLEFLLGLNNNNNNKNTYTIPNDTIQAYYENNKPSYKKIVSNFSIILKDEKEFATDKENKKVNFKEVVEVSIILMGQEYTYFFPLDYVLETYQKTYSNTDKVLNVSTGKRVISLLNVQTMNFFVVFGVPNGILYSLLLIPEISVLGSSFKISTLLQLLPLISYRGIPIPFVGYLFYTPGRIDLLNYSIIVSYFITIPVVALLFKLLLQVVLRVLSMIGLVFMSGPFAIAKSPLDNGEAIKKWAKQLTSKMFQLFFIFTALYIANQLMYTILLNEDVHFIEGTGMFSSYFIKGILCFFVLKGIDLWLKNNDKILDFDNQTEEQIANQSAQKLEQGIKSGVKGVALGAVGVAGAIGSRLGDFKKALKQAKKQGISKKDALFGKNGKSVFNKAFREQLNNNELKMNAAKDAKQEAAQQFNRDAFDNQVLNDSGASNTQKDIIKGLRSDDKKERKNAKKLIKSLRKSGDKKDKEFLNNLNQHYSKGQQKGKLGIRRDKVDEEEVKRIQNEQSNALKEQENSKSND